MSRAPAPPRARPSPIWRRALTFVLLVGGGLGALSLLDEAPEPARGSGVANPERVVEEQRPGVEVLDPAGRTETELVLGRMDFDVSREVEVSPGVFEKRVAYTIRFEEGRPGEGGQFELVEPHLLMLDPLSGEPTGELSARRGRCRTDQAAGGNIQLQPASLYADGFALEGEVTGYAILEDGTRIDVSTEAIRQEGDLIAAPGPIVLDRGDLRLEAVGLTWRRDLARLELAEVTLLSFSELAPGLSGRLSAGGGLSWQAASEGRPLAGFGELRGGVVGDLDDGSHLEAERLAFDEDSGGLSLLGDASIDLISAEGNRHAEAQRLSLARDDAGQLTFAEAEGDVLLESTDLAGLTTRLEAESLSEVEGALVSNERVSWQRDGASLAGTGLRWERTTGLLSFERDVALEVADSHPSEFAGLSLTADGGARWELPVDGSDALAQARGLLQGPLVGQLPDGRALSADALSFDGPGGELVLEGHASVTSLDSDSRLTLSGGRLTLVRDELGKPASLYARDDVSLVDAPLDGSPAWHLGCAQLDLREGRAVAPGQVVAHRGDTALIGFDLAYDGEDGSFSIDRDIVATLSDGTLVRSPQGLRWILPDDPDAGPRQGHGELLGPVTGERPDGSSFRADRAELDGGSDTVSLRGDVQVRLDAERLLRSERLDLLNGPDGRQLSSPAAVHYRAPRLDVRGEGLLYDEARRFLLLSGAPRVVQVDEAGVILVDVQAAGSLRWDAPADPLLPWDLGSGLLIDEVLGRTGDGMTFEGGQVEVDGLSGRVDLRDDAQVQLPDEQGGLLVLSAAERLTVLRDPEAGVVWVDALGDVSGSVTRPGDTLRVRAAALVLDRVTGALILDGESLFERVRPSQRMVLVGDAGSRLVALTDADGALSSLAGEGRITSSVSTFKIVSDQLDWDVPADYMVLSGNAQVHTLGGVVPSPKVEVWPDEWRWTVHPQVVSGDDG